MKILFVTTRIPYPITNGEDLRIFHFAKHLSERHELHLLAYSSDAPPAPEVAGFFRCVHTVENSPFQERNDRKSVFGLVDSLSPDKMCYFDPRIASKLDHVLKQPFDLLWIPAWEMIPYARDIREIPVFLDVMDDGVLEMARELGSNRSVKKAAVSLKRLFVTFLFERKYLQHASLCVFVSERDAEMFPQGVP